MEETKMANINLKINGIDVTVPAGTKIGRAHV